MVKVSADKGIVSIDSSTKKVVANLFADTKEEVTDGMEVVGLDTDYTLDTESTVITADGEIAFMKSDGTWNWV